MNKLVSVIIPMYSRPDFIIRAIESVKHQTYTPIEIIVVDDNGIGTEYQIETEKLLDSYIYNQEIIYIKHDVNKNGSAARNTGFKASNGEYVTYLDDDDEMLPLKIERQVVAIQKAPEKVAMAYCGCKTMKGNKIIKQTNAARNGNFRKEILQGKFGLGSGSNLLIRRKAIEKIGGYNEGFKRHQDLEFAIRLFRHFDIIGVNEILLIKHNDSKPKRPSSRDYLEIEEYFLHSFEPDITSFSRQDTTKVYYNSYLKMAIGAANEHDFTFMIQMLRRAITYKVISLRDFLRIIKNYICQPQKR